MKTFAFASIALVVQRPGLRVHAEAGLCSCFTQQPRGVGTCPLDPRQISRRSSGGDIRGSGSRSAQHH